MNEEIKVIKDDRGVEYKCMTYTSRFTGETDVSFDIQQYMNNGNMYIGLGCNEEGYLEPFADLTVNLGYTTPNYCAYVDTNNLPDAETFVTDNELGTPLRVGSSGPAVRKMQEQLNRISDHYPAIPKIAADGDFGPATEEAVKTFQRVFNLTVDGIVGRATWYRISQVYTAVTRMAELN
jgi:hypothetical protein